MAVATEPKSKVLRYSEWAVSTSWACCASAHAATMACRSLSHASLCTAAIDSEDSLPSLSTCTAACKS
eukprot:8031449-Pyramimonas_sp.AAC.1